MQNISTFIWFSHKRKEEMLIQSILSVVKNVSIPRRIVVAFDNSKGELPSQELKDVLMMAKNKFNVPCMIYLTKFDRRGNLNGIVCISNMFDIYKRFADSSNAIFKIDDDVVVFRDEYFKNFLNSDKLVLGLERESEIDNKESNFWGAFYGFKTDFIKELIQIDLNEGIAGLIYQINEREKGYLNEIMYPEDIVFSHIAKALISKENRMIVPINFDRGFMAGWQYAKVSYKFYFDKFDLVNFGNIKLIKDKTNIVQYMRKTMEDALMEFENDK